MQIKGICLICLILNQIFYYTFIIVYYSDNRSVSIIDNKDVKNMKKKEKRKDSNQIK